jgi:hypothetical protein
MPSRRARPFASLAVLACLVPLLAACAGLVTSVKLPPKASPSGGAPARRTRPPSRRRQVMAAFTGYNVALRAATNSRSAAKVRLLMRPYINGATIANLVRFDRRLWSKDEIVYGHIGYHVLDVRLDGDHAFVHDCDDTSGSGLADARTGQVIPGSLGVKDQNIVTRLNLVHGRWLIGIQTIEDVPCKP